MAGTGFCVTMYISLFVGGGTDGYICVFLMTKIYISNFHSVCVIRNCFRRVVARLDSNIIKSALISLATSIQQWGRRSFVSGGAGLFPGRLLERHAQSLQPAGCPF